MDRPSLLDNRTVNGLHHNPTVTPRSVSSRRITPVNNGRHRSLDVEARSCSPPWVPPGILQQSTPKPFATPLTGTRRNKAVEHSHVFLGNPKLPPTDPSNICWLYTSFDFKAHITLEQAIRTATHQIDRLVDKMSAINPPSPPQPFERSAHFKDLSLQAREIFLKNRQKQGNSSENRANRSYTSNNSQRLSGDVTDDLTLPNIPSTIGVHLPIQQEHVPFVSSPQATMYPQVNGGAAFCKGHLIFDIISTRKHIGKNPYVGPPYCLGQEIYKYVDFMYGPIIAISFVGISDNTARRVGRDMYYSASDDLSKTKIDFSFVDNQHMFVVFPEINCLRISFPESMIVIKKRQAQAEAEAFDRAEMLRIREEREREARRPKFVVPHPPIELGWDSCLSARSNKTERRYN